MNYTDMFGILLIMGWGGLLGFVDVEQKKGLKHLKFPSGKKMSKCPNLKRKERDKGER